MIIVYSTKAFDKLVKSKLKNNLQSQLDAAVATVEGKHKLSTCVKLSLKAKRQPRRKDGRFAKPLPKPATVENNPLVAFDYPRSDAPWIIKPRIVRLISATPTHITGLESQPSGWKYKKFLATKAKSFKIMSFNPQAMS
jgi:hypothetical protein